MEARPEDLVLREHAHSFGVMLADHEVRAMRNANAGITVVATGSPGRYDIETSHHVGTVVTRDRRIVIRPKLGMRRVLYLLSHAADDLRFGLPTLLAEHGDDADLLDAMQALFANALDGASQRGLVWDYREHEEALPSPRGRIDVRALVMRRFGLLPPVDCTFDHFTADTDPNRRMLTAANLLSRGALSLTKHGALLRRAITRFQDVTPMHTRGSTRREAGRRWERYRPALALSDLVLSHASLELEHGRVDSVGFVVNMNVCFEKFVTTALRGALGLDERTWVRHPRGLSLDTRGVLSLTPDIVWRTTDGKPLLVVDAKYKRTTSGNVDDVVQMMSYCLALGLKRGVLVYGEAGCDRHVIPGPGIEVYVEPLSPDGTVADIEAHVAALAARLRQIAEQRA